MATAVPKTAGVTPNNSPLSELRRGVVDYVQGGDDPELLGVATRELNRSIDRVNSALWHKMVSKQTIASTLSTADYALNRDFKDPIKCELLNVSSEPNGRLPYKPYKVLIEENPAAEGTGDPAYYTVFWADRLLSLSIAPSQAWVDEFPFIRVHYHKRLARFVEPNDTHGGPPEFDAFLTWHARSAMARIRGELGAGREARAEAESLWRDLRTSDNEIFTDWTDR